MRAGRLPVWIAGAVLLAGAMAVDGAVATSTQVRAAECSSSGSGLPRDEPGGQALGGASAATDPATDSMAPIRCQRELQNQQRPEGIWWPSSAELLGSVYGECGLRECCKFCVIGKACGDTCISRRYTCHVGCGCACQRPLFFLD